MSRKPPHRVIPNASQQAPLGPGSSWQERVRWMVDMMVEGERPACPGGWPEIRAKVIGHAKQAVGGDSQGFFTEQQVDLRDGRGPRLVDVASPAGMFLMVLSSVRPPRDWGSPLNSETFMDVVQRRLEEITPEGG